MSIRIFLYLTDLWYVKLDYNGFKVVAAKLDRKFQRFFKPSIFLSLSRLVHDGRLDRYLAVQKFFGYVLRRGMSRIQNIQEAHKDIILFVNLNTILHIFMVLRSYLIV